MFNSTKKHFKRNEIDYMSFYVSCDHELPTTSIENFINNIQKEAVKEKEVDLHNIESDTKKVSGYELSSSSKAIASIQNDDRKIVNRDVHKSESILICQKKHKNKNDLIKKYKCDICKTTFHKRSLIIEHFRTSVCFPASPFDFENNNSMHDKCNNTNNSMLYNNSIHSSKQTNKFRVCDSRLIQNKKSMKSIKIPYIKENSLSSKANRCSLSEIEACVCEKCYINNCTKEKSKIIRTFSCDICYKQFTKQSSLISHKKCHSLIKSSNQCKFCKKYFSSELSVSKHINRIHALSQNYECSRCSKMFHERSQIVSHLFESHPEDYSKYSCNACYKLNNCSGNFISHAEKKLLKCEVCPQLFTTSYRRQEHYKCHLGINNFKCQFCSKLFVKYSSYLSHEQTHTGKKLFRCNFCDKSFPVSSDDVNIYLTFFEKKQSKSMSDENVLNQASNSEEHMIPGTSNETKVNETNKNKFKKLHINEEINCEICLNVFQNLSQFKSHVLKIHF